jgi:NAD(P)-dependent dehydrogenase (short-subunit alcohol dehydrogenase family)
MPDYTGYDGPKLLVVGGSRAGIGTAVANYAVKREWNVFVPDLYELDVTKSGTIELYLRRHGPFDHIVYSVGWQKLQFIQDLDFEMLARINDLNVNGYLRVVQKLVKNQASGNVCAIVSTGATTPMRGSVAYCSSKAALLMAIRCMARELAPNWIMTGISPGVVDETPMTKSVDEQVMRARNWTREEMLAYEMKTVPMGRRVTREEVGAAVLMMLTAPEMITGSIMDLSGGK